ncbi:MAG: hypothetical protein US25_C0035G0009 [Candidatus Moranbacteria bacterium GW2011_GWE1_36_7]|nr:MAG: hypothetical protein US25_C0035G0009 [Candidatus Moranbacteria bacterium GW2011_GWE1_36_7]
MKTEDFLEASKAITQEKMDAKRGQISESQMLTAQYLCTSQRKTISWIGGKHDKEICS